MRTTITKIPTATTMEGTETITEVMDTTRMVTTAAVTGMVGITMVTTTIPDIIRTTRLSSSDCRFRFLSRCPAFEAKENRLDKITRIGPSHGPPQWRKFQTGCSKRKHSSQSAFLARTETGIMEALAHHVKGGVIPDCGHYMMEEQPELVAGELLRFFESNEGGDLSGT
jgi:hypothetical protein